ncbi:hypothetical protein ACM26V_07100 [Salipaludibacillus sp. HK11]|uniref:hypothetical protein n=1 Tax=Salipaludibacillus sp. HK11 TaxID=3394320 RepID=UPI0039FC0D24
MFHPLTTWSLGPLTVSVELLFLVIAGIVGLATVSMYLKRKSVEDHEAMLDKVSLVFIIWVLVFKLWPFVLEPGLLTDMRNVIYFSGGPWSIETATGLAFGLLLYFYIRKKWSFDMWEAMIVGLFVAMIFFNVFVREMGTLSPWPFGYKIGGEFVHPVNLYLVWLYILALLGATVFFKAKTGYGRCIYLIISLGFIYILISPFNA